MTIERFLREKSERVERALDVCVSSWAEGPPGMVEAIRYSLFAGGKRLRPALALGAAELVCGEDTPALPAACAVEMVHTYSLIHDDLPAMDNDDMRRGRPTSHRVFGEAAAILAGDALLAMAFEEIARSGNLDAVRELARAAGVAGMAGGQYLDMQAEGQALTLEQLRDLHARKTSALITVSLRLGAMLAGAGTDALQVLTDYGRHLGLAFQIADDILDVEGEAALLGKSIGKDRVNEKSTYPALLGLEEARGLARAAAQEACDRIEAFGRRAETFRALAWYVVERNR